MARRIRWQILIAVVSGTLVLALMSYLAVSTAAVRRPVEGGDYVEALLYAPRQINPLIGDPASDQGAADIQALVFDGLVRVGVDGLPEAGLARTWTVDETGTIYTFTLRDGVRWHDGRPFTAADVLFTMRAIQGPAFTGSESLRAVWRSVTVDQLDEQTVRCRLTAPFAAFLAYAAFPILPAHLLADTPPERWTSGAFAAAPVGTGPYQVAQLTAQRALLRANPGYFRGRPFLDSIELRYYDSPQTALNDLVRGAVQGLSFTSASDLRSFNVPRTLARHTAPLDSYTTLTFNMREGPLADAGVRRALAVGLDRAALIDQVLGGDAHAIDTPILPQWWAAAPEVGWPPPSRERAAALLDDLGYGLRPDGTRAKDGQALQLELLTDAAPDRLAAAQEVARQWSALGVGVQVTQLTSEELQRRLAAHQFMMAIHAWQRLGSDPDIYELWHSSQADQGRNYAGLRDPEVDKAIDDARQAASLDLRDASYTAFQRRWIDLSPSLPLYQPLLVYLTTDSLGGVSMDAPPDPEVAGQPFAIGRESRFRDVSRWFLRSAREIRGDLRQP